MSGEVVWPLKWKPKSFSIRIKYICGTALLLLGTFPGRFPGNNAKMELWRHYDGQILLKISGNVISMIKMIVCKNLCIYSACVCMGRAGNSQWNSGTVERGTEGCLDIRWRSNAIRLIQKYDWTVSTKRGIERFFYFRCTIYILRNRTNLYHVKYIH